MCAQALVVLSNIRGLRQEAGLEISELPFLDHTEAMRALKKLEAKLGFKAADGQGGGVFATKITADGPAAQATLRDGDKIVSAKGTPLQTAAAMNEVLKTCLAGDLLQLEVVRKQSLDQKDSPSETLTLEVAGKGDVTVSRVKQLRVLAGVGLPPSAAPAPAKPAEAQPDSQRSVRWRDQAENAS